MSVRLDEAELDDFLTCGHTLALSTVRRSGEPFTTPVWYVWQDRAFHVVTFADTAKVAHLRRDPRCCCMVEDGRDWIDLRAVVASCDASIQDDPAVVAAVGQVQQTKYAAFRDALAKLSRASSSYYDRPRVVLVLTPRPGELRSWHNRKLRLRQDPE